MPVLTGPQIATLRTHPHRTKLYAAVLQPTSILTALVNDAGIEKGERSIVYDGGAGSKADVKAGMSLWVGTVAGSQNKGRVRVKSITGTTAAGTIVIAENEHIDWKDDDHLTVKEIYEYWPVYPRITNGGGLTFYKDYDVAYTDQNENFNPVPVIGPPACAFIENGVATVHFDGSDCWVPGSTICWGKPVEEDNCEWTFPNGTPGSSFTASLDVTWDTPGTYMVSLLTKAENGKTTLGYRPVFIFDRTGSNAPYTDFEVRSLRGSVRAGSWSFDVTAFGDADEAEFPAGTLVVLFSESWYGSSAKDFGMNHPGRHNIRAVGWIVDESVKKDPESGEVRFACRGIAGLMGSRENFSVALDYVSGSPTKWYELKEMDWDRALFHYLYWHSTVCTMTDVRVSGELHPSFLGPFKIKFQDFARGSLWSSVVKLCTDCFLVPAADRASCIYIDYAPCFLSAAQRNNVPTAMALGHQDWTETLEIRRVDEKPVNFVDFEGIAFDGTTVTPLIAYAPGRVPEYMGSPKPKKRCVLDPIAPQTRANVRAGYQLAKNNNEFPEIRLSCMGDYSVVDIAPREWLTLTLVAADTKRGLIWDPKRLLVTSIEELHDHTTGDCQVHLTLEAETAGPPGITGDYPPEEPPIPPPEPPPIPEPPLPGGDWRPLDYVGTTIKGLYRTNNLTGPGGAHPTWVPDNVGLAPTTITQLVPDPWDVAHRRFAIAGEEVWRHYNAVTGAAGTWTKVLSKAQVAAVTSISESSAVLHWVEGNINKQGYFYVLVGGYNVGLTNAYVYCFRTPDYGASWTPLLIDSGVTVRPDDIGNIAAGALQGSSPYPAGDVLYATWLRSTLGNPEVSVSLNNGDTWTTYSLLGFSVWNPQVYRDPSDQSIAYVGVFGVIGDQYDLYRSVAHGVGFVEVDGAKELAIGTGVIEGSMRVLIDNNNKMYLIPGHDIDARGAGHLFKSIDFTASWTDLGDLGHGPELNQLSIVMDAPTKLYFGRRVAGDSHVIYISDDEGQTLWGKAGANCGLADGGGDSIPFNCGGVAYNGIIQVWTE